MDHPSRTISRIPELQGALTLRDMGGYPVADRGKTRWQRLYRSGTTHAMTDVDLEWLAARGVCLAYDLRSDTERSVQRNRLQDIRDLRYRAYSHDRVAGDLRRPLIAPGTRREDTRNIMLSLYEELPYSFKDSYRALFLHLADGDLPLVFNCTAGKDRTGVAAALILAVLEVPKPVIFEDYLLTAQFFDQSCDLIFQGAYRDAIKHLSRDVWEPLMKTDADYLKAMFERVENAHGSVVNYFQTVLGLSPGVIGRIRLNLIER
jgi:protein-tyrosine phosphatase